MSFRKTMLFLVFFQALCLYAAADGWGVSSWWKATETADENRKSTTSSEEKESDDETSSLSLDDFEVIDESSDVDKNWQQYFIESSDHNPLISPAVRQKLINKGYSIIKNLVKNRPIDHSIEVFTDAGRNFVESSWFQDIPTMKSLKKGMGKSFAWASSFIINPIDRLENTEALLKQKTTDRRAFLESIISVVWALADHAARLKYCHENLVFTLKDSENILWELIASYAEQCKNNSQDFNNNFAYAPPEPSNSSNTQQILESWAIDVRFESTSWALPLLPYNSNMILFARMLADEFNISPAKTIVATTYKTEGIAAWIYKSSDIDIFSHQRSRKVYGKTFAEYIHDFLQAEGVQKDSEALQAHYSPQMSKSIMSILRRIAQDKQKVHFGQLSHVAGYVLNTNLYSKPAKKYAREFLNFLHKNCGDNIIITQNNVKIDQLVSLRISTEVVADLEQLPMQKIISIEALPAIEIQQEELEESSTTEEIEEEKSKITEIAIAKLFNAIDEQNAEQVKTMIEEQNGIVNKKNMIDKTSESYGRLPLHHALFKPKQVLIDLLLENGSHINQQDRSGRTPLFIAYQFFKEKMVKRVMQEKPAINIPDNRGISVLHLALDYVDPLMLSYFLEHGGDLSAQKQQTLKSIHALIREARKKPSDKALPQDIKNYEARIIILNNRDVKLFIDEHIKQFSKTEQTFFKGIYQKENLE